MKISRFQQYSDQNSIIDDFINSFDEIINESETTEYKKVQDKVISDLRLNGNLSLTFGTGIKALYPIVDKLMTNMSINSADISAESIVLLTICAVTIIYLEEKKYRNGQEEDILTKDSKSMLEELKLKGIGNGIVKKFVKLFKSICGIFNLIGKHIGSIAKDFIDMFAYTTILIPILNGILYVIGKYELNFDTFIANFAAILMGVGTIITKNAIISIVGRLKDRVSISNRKKIIDEVDASIVKKISDFELSPEDGQMITEQ